MPDMPWARCTGEERGEQHVVQQDAISVLIVELERAAVAGFDRTAFSQKHWATRLLREQVAYGISGQ